MSVEPKVEYRNVISDTRRWRGFVHRPGDVFVCTPPKCGTTWMQTIVTTLIFGGRALPDPVLKIAPWLEMRLLPIDEILADLEAQAHRRCIKSHTPADGIPWFEDASYIVVGRDGRDAFMSFLNHVRSQRPEIMAELAVSAVQEGIEIGEFPPIDDVHAFFDHWIADGQLFEFVASYWQRRTQANLLFVHYNELKADLDAQMRRVALFLEIEVDEDRWPELVELCTFESMKSRSADIAPFEILFEGGGDAFLYKGTNDRWREVLTEEELRAYEDRAAELLPADARAWLAGEGSVV